MRSFFFLSFSFLFLSFLLLRNEALHQQSAYEFQHISRNVTTYTTPYFREFLFTHKGNRCRSNCVCHSPLENYSTRDRIVLAWYDFARSSPLLVVTLSNDIFSNDIRYDHSGILLLPGDIGPRWVYQLTAKCKRCERIGSYKYTRVHTTRMTVDDRITFK